jgi:hypothetical protein
MLGRPGNNRVYTLDTLGAEPRGRLSMTDVGRLALRPDGGGRCAWAWGDGADLKGIAAARRRSGPRTWEVSHLLVASDDDPACSTLLSQVCLGAGQRGAERVYIRLLDQDPLIDTARQLGFAASSTEVLYKGRRKLSASAGTSGLREKGAHDEYGLFRLYSASTPSEIRFASGVTFDQWTSSRQRTRWRSREFVYEKDSQVKGHVRAIQRLRSGLLIVDIHPDDESDASALVDYGLARLRWVNTVYCPVPEYHLALQRLLVRKGYDAVAEYTILVKSMAVPARAERALRAVTMASRDGRRRALRGGRTAIDAAVD